MITTGCAKSVSYDDATAARNDECPMRLARSARRAVGRLPARHGLPVVSVPDCRDRLLGQPRCRAGSAGGQDTGVAAWSGRELIMADHERLIAAPTEPAVVRSCWMCGIRLSAGQMVADGGSACADVRWYCLDTRGCTDRWTRRLARSAGLGPGSGRTTKTQGGQLAAWAGGIGRLRCVSHRKPPVNAIAAAKILPGRLEVGWAGRPGRRQFCRCHRPRTGTVRTNRRYGREPGSQRGRLCRARTGDLCAATRALGAADRRPTLPKVVRPLRRIRMPVNA